MLGRVGSKGSMGFFMRVCHGGHFQEDNGEEGEDEALDEADEDFETEKGEGSDIRQEEGDNDEEDFSRKNVPEEPEGEGNHFRALRNKLEDPNEAHDRVLPRSDEVFAGVGKDAKGGNAEDLRHDDGNEGDRERHVHIGIHGAKEGNRDKMPFVHAFDRDTPNTREDTHPVCEDEEEEDCRNEGEELSRFLTILDDGIEEIEEPFDDEFEERLKTSRNGSVPCPPETEGKGEKDKHRKPCHEHGVPKLEGAKVTNGLRSECGGSDRNHMTIVMEN